MASEAAGDKTIHGDSIIPCVNCASEEDVELLFTKSAESVKVIIL
jgi:hypothetical protein